MSAKVHISGRDNNEIADLYSNGYGTGQLVYTAPAGSFIPQLKPLLNDTYGTKQNQAVVFAGTPEIIHDGGDTAGWTGAAAAGTWDFADTTDPQAGTNHVSITSANNLDTASFTDATQIDMTNYTAITGQVNLIAFDSTRNDISIQMLNNGVNVGVPVLLTDYIDDSVVNSYQGFAISKSDLELDEITVDELRIIITRSGGTRPTIYFDVMQIEETGSPLQFRAEPDRGSRYYLTRIIYNWVDAGTGGAAFAYNKIGAVASLPIGLGATVVKNSATAFASSFSQLSDFTSASGVITNTVDDGTNTMVSIQFDFRDRPLILDSRDKDYIQSTVNDDLSGLLDLTVFAQGYKEVLV